MRHLAGPEPVAVVIFSGSDEQLQSAIRGANGELAEYQQIRTWLRWPELNFPYTSTGKLLRRKVAEWACAALAGRETSAPKVGDADPLLKMITTITGAAITHAADTSLLSEDLRLDSLGRVQLQSALEQHLGIELPDDAMENVKALGELRHLIGSHGTTADSTGTGRLTASAASSTPASSSAATPYDAHATPTGRGGLRCSFSASFSSKPSCAPWSGSWPNRTLSSRLRPCPPNYLMVRCSSSPTT